VSYTLQYPPFFGSAALETTSCYATALISLATLIVFFNVQPHSFLVVRIVAGVEMNITTNGNSANPKKYAAFSYSRLQQYDVNSSWHAVEVHASFTLVGKLWRTVLRYLITISTNCLFAKDSK
jgi:hypothetical protein